MLTRRQLAAAALCLPALPLPAIAQGKKDVLKLGILKMAALTDPWVAMRQGMYDKRGLDVHMVEFNTGADAIAAGRGGDVDLLLSIPGTAMTADERGFGLLAVFQNEVAKAGPPDSGSVQVKVNSPIKSLTELKGKKVAVSSLHSQNAVGLQLLIKRLGIPLTDITWLEIPFPSQADLLRAGQVDAVATVDPYTTQLLTSGVGRVISWNYVESIPRQPLGAWFATKRYIDAHGDMIDRFNAGTKEAMDYMNADPDRARAEVTAFTGLKPELVKDMPIIGWDYHVSVPRWQAVADMMHEMGELTKPHKAEEFLAPQIKPYITDQGA
jgi:NitT/TauT family transport system substrate-binding protein